MIYSLMHEDEIVALFVFSDSGLGKVSEVQNELLAPTLPYDPSQPITTKLRKWIEDRGIPKSRQYLNQDSTVPVIDLLIQNYGVSLTDHYWYKPIDVDVTWNEINPYVNEFESSDLLETVYSTEPVEYGHFSPSPSLEGNIKKKWIIKDGKRLMVKGNLNSSICAVNEVFASELHRRQGWQKYVSYSLIKLHSYDSELTGCACECFTSLDTEFVPAHAVMKAYKKPNDINAYECYIRYCVEHGCNEKELRDFLNYMYLTDFIRTEVDRHGSNLGIIRNSHTLEFIGPCPIFDNGNSMFYNSNPVFDNTLFDHEIQPFFECSEQRMLKHVTDFNCVDTDLLPDENYVYETYKEFGKEKAQSITEAYRRKVLFVKNQLQKIPNEKVKEDKVKEHIKYILSNLNLTEKQFIQKYSNLVKESVMCTKNLENTDLNKAYVAYCLLNECDIQEH